MRLTKIVLWNSIVSFTLQDRYSNAAKQKTYIKHNKIYESLRHILCKLEKISYIEIAPPANITIMTGDFTVGQGHCLQFAFEHISILMLPYFIISFIWKSQTISQNSAGVYGMELFSPISSAWRGCRQILIKRCKEKIVL